MSILTKLVLAIVSKSEIFYHFSVKLAVVRRLELDAEVADKYLSSPKSRR